MAVFLPVCYVWDTDLSKYSIEITWSSVQQWNVIVIIVCTTMVDTAENVLAEKE